jgi:hypothetical protein
MNKWTRLVTAAAVAATVTTVGLSAAMAAGPVPSKPDAAANQAVPNSSPRLPVTTETVYVAVAPCRIVDTRVGSGTPITNGATRTYYVGGTTGFAPQGGKSGGCGIPIGATAVTGTITATGASGSGYMHAFPNGASEPNATVLSYTAHQSTGTGATLPINSGSALALKVKNYGGPTDLVIDVTGYYAPQISILIDIGGDLYSGSSRAVSSVRNSTGNYSVVIDTNVANCVATATPYAGGTASYATARTLNTNTVTVLTYNSAGNLQDFAFDHHVVC